ncbi:MAG: hypothetical protein HYV94_21330, partial [Candidatus Rokubacteria bacterium]|nr:hypothetical protein [Candidatus Rokubacteria bacterium]
TAAVMLAFAPFKRSFGREWFQPIARIGRYGKDPYSLGAPSLRARTAGELFLFVNDAVVGVPGLWSVLYGNNTGSATVTIRRIDGTAPRP